MRSLSPLLCSLAVCSFSAVCSVISAEGSENSPSPIIVTADRDANSQWHTTASTSVVTELDQELAAWPLTWTDNLRNMPGVDVFAAGGGLDGGGLMALRLRGAAKDSYTRILIDGVPYYDPTSTDTAPQLSGISISGIQNIEVVRGAQSGLYGSSAMAGVVQLRSAQPGETLNGSAHVGYGTFATVQADAQANGPIWNNATQTIGFNLGVSGVRSDGISSKVTNISDDPTDDETDALWTNGANGRLVWSNDVGASAYVSTLLGGGYHEYDATTPDDDSSYNRQRFARVGAGGTLPVGDGGAFVTLDTAYTDTHRFDTYFDTFSAVQTDSEFDGTSTFGAARLIAPLGQDIIAGVGLDAQRDTADTAGVSDGSQSDLGGYGDVRWSGEQIETIVVLRYDSISSGENALTWRLGAAYFPVIDQLKLHASASTGFRAPSLDELFGDYPAFFFSGNKNLKPETSQSWDAGITFQHPIGVELDSTFFQTRYEDRIRTNATFDSLINEDGSSSVIGVENGLTWRQVDGWWYARAAYTWQQTADVDGDPFTNIPKNKGMVGFGADAQSWFAGCRLDGVGFREGSGDIPLPGYGLVGITGGIRPRENITVTARIDNLFDRHYAPAADSFYNSYYSGVPRTITIGLEALY